jgi:hypothetical protein
MTRLDWEKRMINRIGKIHGLLAEHQFYPLLLSSALAIGLWAGRSWMWAPRDFRFLVWNLFLAWLPYLWSLWALSIHRRRPHRWWLLLLPGALWLLFFPNAPYLVTDLIHLRGYPPVPPWYDIGMLISFAWAGCFLAVASLYIMHQIIRAYAARLSWLIVMARACAGWESTWGGSCAGTAGISCCTRPMCSATSRIVWHIR